MPLLELHSVAKSYGALKVTDDISLARYRRLVEGELEQLRQSMTSQSMTGQSVTSRSMKPDSECDPEREPERE